MAANTSPIFTLTPKSGWAKVTGVDGSMDGTDADVKTVLTAGSDGSFINKLLVQPISTSGSTTTSTAALRIYLNNGSTIGTATNNQLIREYLLNIITVNVAGTSPSIGYEIPLNMQIPASYVLAAGITAVAANTQWNITAIYGDY